MTLINMTHPQQVIMTNADVHCILYINRELLGPASATNIQVTTMEELGVHTECTVLCTHCMLLSNCKTCIYFLLHNDKLNGHSALSIQPEGGTITYYCHGWKSKHPWHHYLPYMYGTGTTGSQVLGCPYNYHGCIATDVTVTLTSYSGWSWHDSVHRHACLGYIHWEGNKYECSP